MVTTVAIGLNVTTFRIGVRIKFFEHGAVAGNVDDNMRGRCAVRRNTSVLAAKFGIHRLQDVFDFVSGDLVPAAFLIGYVVKLSVDAAQNRHLYYPSMLIPFYHTQCLMQ